jgi:hypothetical protein
VEVFRALNARKLSRIDWVYVTIYLRKRKKEIRCSSIG